MRLLAVAGKFSNDSFTPSFFLIILHFSSNRVPLFRHGAEFSFNARRKFREIGKLFFVRNYVTRIRVEWNSVGVTPLLRGFFVP